MFSQLLKHYFWVCLQECFQKSQHLNQYTEGRRFDSCQCGQIQSLRGPNRTKRWRKSELTLCLLELDIHLPSSSALGHWSSRLQDLQTRTELYHHLFGSSICRYLVRLFRLLKLMSQFSQSSLIYLIYLHILLVLFLWRTLANTIVRCHSCRLH